MKTLKSSIFVFVALAFWGVLFTSCEKDEPDDPTPTISQFVSLENPYLICANRNPGGVGFDFEYKGEKGGGNNMDSLTVSDFEYDLKIRTINVEKPDESLGGAPFIQFYETVKAVNYSRIDTTCIGYSDFQNLTNTNIQNYTLQSDNSSCNLASLPVGATGSLLMQNLNQELNKLVIGQRWKDAAGNTIVDNEPIWIIQTREEKNC